MGVMQLHSEHLLQEREGKGIGGAIVDEIHKGAPRGLECNCGCGAQVGR